MTRSRAVALLAIAAAAILLPLAPPAGAAGGPPTITDISPGLANPAGETKLTILGSYFLNPISVSIDGTAATDVVIERDRKSVV